MSLPEPLDLTHHLSYTTRARVASDIKAFYKYFLIPGIGQLAGGLPHPDYFPFDTLEAKTSYVDRWNRTPNKPVEPPKTPHAAISTLSLPSSHLVVPKLSNAPDVTSKIDVSTALQYSTAEGYPPLVQWVRHFTTQHLHPSIPYKGGADVVLTLGNTDGFAKAIQALSNEWVEGRNTIAQKEGILVEKYAYMNAIQAVVPRGLTVAPVEVDAQGMSVDGPGGLEDVVENWDYSKGARPHLMYTVTVGQNPTSGVLSVERRKQIYALCVKYDVIIIEDDPYWFLQYPSGNSPEGLATLEPKAKSSGFDFLDSLVPSYLSIDYQGRVIRLDTFSKSVAPGSRLGWITAQPKLVERILRITETNTAQPSGFVQSMVAELVMGPHSKHDGSRGGGKDGNGWQVAGWVRWLEGLRGNYEKRMNAMSDELDKGKVLVKAGSRRSLVNEDWSVVETTQIYDFVRPMGGMFVWVRFNFSSHPLTKTVPLARLSRALWIYWTTKPYLVLVAPGTIFGATSEIREQDAWNCFRLSFAACDENLVGPLGKRFAQAAQSFWRIKSKEKIDKLISDADDESVDTMGIEHMDLGRLIGHC